MLKCSGGHEDFIESDIASCTASVVGRACLLLQASSRFYLLCAPGYTSIGCLAAYILSSLHNWLCWVTEVVCVSVCSECGYLLRRIMR